MEDVIRLPTECCYSPEAAQRVRNLYNASNEKVRRRFAASLAAVLTHGGVCYVAEVLGCSESTIRLGLHELDDLEDGDPLEGRVRAEGAGRPPKPSPVPS